MNFKYINQPNSTNNINWHEEDDHWKAENVYKILDKNNLHPNSICEIGYGAGGLLLNLAKYYDEKVNFYGYETSEAAYRVSKPKETTNVIYNLKDLLLEDVYYDVILAINVLARVKDYLGFLSKLRTKAEYKVFHIQLQLSIYTMLRSDYFQKKDHLRSPLHLFNKETALGTLQGTGYQIIDYFYTSPISYLKNPKGKEKVLLFVNKFFASINPDFAAKYLGGFSLMVLTK